VGAVLGVSAYYHDSAAALVVDGNIVAAMQEERFSRRKNDPGLPRSAIKACLAQAGLSADDLDKVVYYENPYARLERVTLSCFGNFPRSWRQFPSAMRSQIGEKIWVLDALAKELRVPRSKIAHTDHHRSHAASTFFASSFDRAAILTIDGMGEAVSTAIWLGEGSNIDCLCDIAYPHSIGLLYAAVTSFLGFEINEGEYKVMGLAAFGKPLYRAEFDRLIRIENSGEFELDLSYFAFHTDIDLGFTTKLEELLGPRRVRGKPWDLRQDTNDRRFANIAASLQLVTEEAVLALAREARRRTGADELCLAGGVALNCVSNARIVRESEFKRVFVQPAAGDAGGALGAAFLGSIELEGTRPSPMRTAALGTEVSNDRSRSLCESLGIAWEEPTDVYSSVAEIIEQNKVVAFVRGRFEWGPRALGQRSLLAAPGDVAVRDRVNSVVKRRELFRPFAPAVLGSKAGNWFRDHDSDMAPYMTTVARVLPGNEQNLGAVTHVDGTARIQTVNDTAAVDLCRLLGAVERRGHLPILLNTSLNGSGEPIVANEVDAIAFFLSHPIDSMLLGDILLSKRGQ
jgi:carbamoyltransferase